MLWRSFSTSYLQPWALHCWLSRAGSPCLHCTRMVRTVCCHGPSSYSKFDWFCSCTSKDLTVTGGRRSRRHTETLVSELELGVLWDEYGLVGDLVVCHLVGPFKLFHLIVMLHSRLQMIFHVRIYTNWSRRIYSISSSKEPLKITSSHGCANTLLIHMDRHGQTKFLMILINGMTNPNVLNPVLIIVCVVRIAAAPPFSGLRRFPQGRGFKQWTGDDSKALMKVRSWLLLVKFEFNHDW